MTSALSPEDWRSALDLLAQGLALDASQREAWLRDSPAPLRPLLRQLLDDRRALETDKFLDAMPTLGSLPPPAADWQPGQRIGPYELQRELGHGGMASVWLARRADGAHQRAVALKLPFVSARSRHLAERFAREQQILSALSHPHIASVLDAGSDAGQPWLAMEYVDGRSLTDWASDRQLDVDARLSLFLQILQAVQHAHAQLVIHRDLKPGNVLVDAHGQVKLLDFGVAKLLDDDNRDLTREGGRAMTPAYASPEQLRGTTLGTASDLYTLGVLLQELLTGLLPYQRPGEPRPGAGALEAAILDGRLVPPSQAVTDPATAGRLRGDIDTLVMKALHPEPALRYASAAAFAEDIERHLQHLPIAARPQTRLYRLRKLWRRQRLLLLAGAAVTIALAIGISMALWQSRRALEEARRAEAVQQFLVKLLQRSDPQQGQARDLPAGELLDLSVASLDSEFKHQPAVQAQLMRTLATIYTGRGEPAKAQPLMERAIAFYAAQQPGSEVHVQALVERVAMLDAMNDFTAERRAAAQTMALAEQHFGRNHRWLGTLLANLAWAEFSQGELASAATHGEQARETFARQQGAQSVDAVDMSGTLATIYMTQGRLREARTLLLDAEARERDMPDRPLIERAMTDYNLARIAYIQGEQAEAQARLKAWLPQLDRVAGPAHPRTLMTRALLAQSLAEDGQTQAAITEQRANLAALMATTGIDEDEAATQQITLARLLRLGGLPEEGLPLARAALARVDARYQAPTYRREAMRRVLGELQLALGQREEGLRSLQTALANLQSLPASGSTALGSVDILIALAVAQREQPLARDLIAQACKTAAGYQTDRSLPLRRCEVLQAWITALQAPPEDRAAAAARFTAIRNALFAAGLPEAHLLRAELQLANAEIVASSRKDSARLQIVH